MSPTKARFKLGSKIINEIKQRDKYGLKGKQSQSQILSQRDTILL